MGLSPEWRLTLPNPKNKEDLHKQADNAADEHHDLRDGNLSSCSRELSVSILTSKLLTIWFKNSGFAYSVIRYV